MTKLKQKLKVHNVVNMNNLIVIQLGFSNLTMFSIEMNTIFYFLKLKMLGTILVLSSV
jgi:hypothetical protein